MSDNPPEPPTTIEQLLQQHDLDISWIDNLPNLTPDQIRQRVAAMTPQQRQALLDYGHRVEQEPTTILDRSSLGSPNAKAIQNLTPPETIRAIQAGHQPPEPGTP